MWAAVVLVLCLLQCSRISARPVATGVLQCNTEMAEAFNRFALDYSGYDSAKKAGTVFHYFDIAEDPDEDDCDRNYKCCSNDFQPQTIQLELMPECAAAFAKSQASVLLDNNVVPSSGISVTGNSLNIAHQVHPGQKGNPDLWTLITLAFPASHACSKGTYLTSGPCPPAGCTFRMVISNTTVDTPQGCTSQACASSCCTIRGNTAPGKSVAGVAEAFQCKALAAAVPSPRGLVPEVDTRSDTDFPVKFLVVGDWGAAVTPTISQRENPDRRAQALVAQAMAATALCQKSQFVMGTGDNFYQAGLRMANDSAVNAQWRSVYQQYPSLRPLKWYSVYGNHDYPYGKVTEIYPECLLQNITWAECQARPCCYSSLWQRTSMMNDPRWMQENGTVVVSKGPLLDLVLIDTNPFIKSYFKPNNGKSWPYTPGGLAEQNPAETRKQMNNALTASTATWRIVMGHHPLENQGRRCGGSKLFGLAVDECDFLRDIKEDLWAHNIPLYMNGHDHSQQLTTNTTGGRRTMFLTSGAGGRKSDPIIKGPSLLFPTSNSNSMPETFLSDVGFATVALNQKQLVLKLYSIGKYGEDQGLVYQAVLNSQDYAKPAPGMQGTNKAGSAGRP